MLGIVSTDAHDAGADEDDFHALRRRTSAVVREEKAQQRAERITQRLAAPISSNLGSSSPALSQNIRSTSSKSVKVVKF